MIRSDKDDNSALHKTVQEEVNRKLEHDKDVERRRKNIVIYKVLEVSTDYVSDRNASDLAFVTKLLDTVFGLQLDQQSFSRMFRLGKKDDSSATPRPLLVEFSNLDTKEHVMSNLRNLREANPPFKGISLAHDLTPWQRADIKKLVEQAKRDHSNASSESVENYIFRVVGQGASKRVIKVQRQR